jgi:DNA replication protein DnaC
VFWLNIPTTVHRWRLDGLSDAIKWDIEKATAAEILVVDDLGRETRRREHAEDAAQGHLDAILTARERENHPVLWTTNSTEPELVDRYGEGMIRRLTRLNPMIWLND